MAEQTHGSDQHEEHASIKTYLVIGLILTIITVVEVATYYDPLESMLGSWLVPSLIIMSAAKFFIVVGFFMHLKYDDRIFRRMFLGPLAGAFLIMLSLIFLFGYHSF